MLIQVNLLGFCTCYVFERSENDSLPKTVHRFHFILQSYHWLSSITPILFVTHIHNVHFDSPQVYRFQVIEVSIHLPNLRNGIASECGTFSNLTCCARFKCYKIDRNEWKIRKQQPTKTFRLSDEINRVTIDRTLKSSNPLDSNFSIGTRNPSGHPIQSNPIQVGMRICDNFNRMTILIIHRK